MKPIPLNNPERQSRHRFLISILLVVTACLIIATIITQDPWWALTIPISFYMYLIDP